MNLNRLGFNNYIKYQIKKSGIEKSSIARVIKEHKERQRVWGNV